ncbi:MAG: hypothetical protein CM15mP62_26100 [Rhodospirillaceae bacterium]|nr:MAG: hypothetical protein CM15mP62_26100 [Rhodospirillaceae bacterium]
MESYDGGSDETRGRDGILRATDEAPDICPLHERKDSCGRENRIPYTKDYNGLRKKDGITQVTINKGRRQSQPTATRPARNRPNLTIVSGAMAETLILKDKTCHGVKYW